MLELVHYFNTSVVSMEPFCFFLLGLGSIPEFGLIALTILIRKASLMRIRSCFSFSFYSNKVIFIGLEYPSPPETSRY